MKTLLVTGGAGFIGSNFIRHAVRHNLNWNIVNLDLLTYAGNVSNLLDLKEHPRYTFVKGDIAHREFVNGLFQKVKFDAVVNFAAESHVDRSILDSAPFIETNVKGTQVLLEAARQHPVERFIHISTDEVYGSLGEKGAFSEDSLVQPNSPYAASKAAADMLCRAYFKAYHIPVLITRSSNNYGPFQFPEKLIPLMIHNTLTGKKLPVYGKGLQVRDWLYVEDNCRAISMVLHKGRVGEIYNIGGDCEKKNVEVVESICRILKEKPRTGHLEPEIEYIKDPRGAAHDFRYALDCSKIQRELGWTVQQQFLEGLERTVEWYVDNQDWIRTITTGEYQTYYEKVYGA